MKAAVETRMQRQTEWAMSAEREKPVSVDGA